MTPNLLESAPSAIEDLLTEPNLTKQAATQLVGKYTQQSAGIYFANAADTAGSSTELVHFSQRPSIITAVATEPSQEYRKAEEDVKEEEERFFGALKEYQESATEKYKIDIDMKETHNMSDVWALIDEAMEEYNSKATQGFLGRVRKAFRKLGEHEQAIDGWLGLLPKESHYLSVVCGGLKIILSAAARMHKVREEVVKALEDIPNILNGAQRALGALKGVDHLGTERLQTCSSALYVAVLRALGHVLLYIQLKVVSKGLKALLNQSSYALALTEKIEDIMKCRNAFNNEVSTCHLEMNRQVKDTSKLGHQATHGALQKILNGLSIITSEQSRVNKALENELSAQRQVLSEQGQSIEEYGKKLSTIEGVVVQLKELLTSSPICQIQAAAYIAPLEGEGLDGRRKLLAPSNDASLRSKASERVIDRMLSRLDYDPDAPGTDVANIAQIALTLSMEDQQRSSHVTQSPLMSSWLSSPASQVLVANGHSQQIQRRSALSFVCAKMISTLNGLLAQSVDGVKSRIFSIHYFCGEHIGSGGGSGTQNSAYGAMNSLLAQLLVQCASLGLVPDIKVEELDGSSFRSLWDCFEDMFLLLPPDAVVFCVIEGLPFYMDDRSTKKHALKLFDKLISLVSSRQVQGRETATMKLFLTANGSFHGREREWLKGDSIIDVPRTLRDTGGYTEHMWNAGMGKKLYKIV